MSSAKEFLQQLEVYDSIINRKMARCGRLRAEAMRTTPVMREVCVQAGGYLDRIGDKVCAIADLEREIDFYVDIYADIKQEAMLMLARMANEKQREVLYRRYIEGKPLKKVQTEMHYRSYRGICYLHGNALAAFQKIMEEVETSEGH